MSFLYELFSTLKFLEENFDFDDPRTENINLFFA